MINSIIKEKGLQNLTGTRFLEPAEIKVEGGRVHVLCEIKRPIEYQGIKFYPNVNEVYGTVKMDLGEQHLIEGLERINKAAGRRSYAVAKRYKEFEGFWRGRLNNRERCTELLGPTSRVNRNHNRTESIRFDASVSYGRVYCVASRHKGEYNLAIRNLSEEQAKEIIKIIGGDYVK